MAIESCGAIYAERIDRLVKIMDAEGWDCVLASSPESVLYFSGALIHTQMFMRRRQCAVLVTRNGAATLIVAEVEKALATRMSALPYLATYKELSESICLASIGLLQQQGRSPSAIGIEKTHLPAVDFEVLLKHLPDALVVGVDEQLSGLRMLKSAGEVETMSFAAAIMDEAILTTVNGTRAFAREDEIATQIMQHVQRLGQGRLRSATGLVASGENLHVQHHVGDATQLKDGNFVRVGCRTVCEGYYGSVVRMAVVGKGSPRSLDHYSRLHRAHTALIDSLRPGITAGQVYERSVAARRALGVDVGLVHVGYGTGLEFMERPKLASGVTDVLQAGMIMQAISNSRSDDPADGGLRYIVDMVLLEPQGPRLLSNVSDTARPLL